MQLISIHTKRFKDTRQLAHLSCIIYNPNPNVDTSFFDGYTRPRDLNIHGYKMYKERGMSDEQLQDLFWAWAYNHIIYKNDKEKKPIILCWDLIKTVNDMDLLFDPFLIFREEAREIRSICCFINDRSLVKPPFPDLNSISAIANRLKIKTIMAPDNLFESALVNQVYRILVKHFNLIFTS